MARLRPRTVARLDQIRAALREEGTLPISTMNLWDKLGNCMAYSELLRLLNYLAEHRQVEKIRPDGLVAIYWRLCD